MMNLPTSVSPELTRLLAACASLVQADSRAGAAWLAGSFGRGDADAYSDIDLHVLVPSEADADAIEADMSGWLAPVAPLVGAKKVFTHLYHCVTTKGDRIDVLFYVEPSHETDTREIVVLKDNGGVLRHADGPLFDAAKAMSVDVAEIWRMTLLLPVMLGRGEYLRLFHGISIKYGFILNLLVRGRGYPRPVGVKKLNDLLRPEDRQRMAEAVRVPILDAVSLARAELRLAAIVRDLGPECCARIGVPYPQEWEDVTRGRLQRDLPSLGMGDILRETLNW
ncbi:MAG: nucleotidyltransferase domain-containing protein [Akkermansiaceae bacterium]|nr:nucleotidyltransferase domain-containing protein [Armatimonadota bacterium]